MGYDTIGIKGENIHRSGREMQMSETFDHGINECENGKNKILLDI